MTSMAAGDWLASSLVALLAPAQGVGPDLATTATASAQALAPALLQANALPSRVAHPAQLEAWAAMATGLWSQLLGVLPRLADSAFGVDGEAILHRHVSAALLRDEALGLGWIDGLEDPALPLCLAPTPLFESVLRAAGLVLLGPAIRQIIVRTELAHIERQLGPESMAFVRRVAPRLWPGEGRSPRIRVDEVDQQVERWGVSLLAHAFSAAEAPVARRGRLRLPPASAPAVADTRLVLQGHTIPPLADAPPLPASLSEPPQALALCRALIHERDAAWLSHFPALR